MAGWHSLSGYLHYKPGGTLGRFKSRRKQWYIYDESKCQLIYYKNQEDSLQKSPLGSINIGSSAISLNLDYNNQFVITTDGTDHLFTADNHESMMIWLLGLQAKRDAYCNRSKKKDENDTLRKPGKRRTHPNTGGLATWRSSAPSIRASVSHSRTLQDDMLMCRQYTVHEADEYVPPSLRERSVSSPDKPMRRLRKTGTVDATMEQYYEHDGSTRSLHNEPRLVGCGRVTTPPQDGPGPWPRIPLSRSFSTCPYTSSATHGGAVNDGTSTSTTYSDEEPEVFDYDALVRDDVTTTPSREAVRPRTKCGSDSTDHSSVYGQSAQPDGQERSNSWSGQSSDSAIDRGDHCDIHHKLTDMEKELMNTKCELAKVLNRESTIKEVLERRDHEIQKLDEKLERYESMESLDGGNNNSETAAATPGSEQTSDTISPSSFSFLSSASYTKKMKEQCRVLQNQNRFLNEEVKKLTKLRQLEMTKFNEQQGQNQELSACIELWKRDYLSLLQSSIYVPSGDILDGMEVNLYGGNRHREKIQYLLEEARKVNPLLPTYERLAQGETHVDEEGFKHCYDNEGLLLHYLCTELSKHYSSQLAWYEKHQLRWKEIFCHKKISNTTYKDLKPLCRMGVPRQYRGEVWRQLVQRQVADLRTTLGQHYYNNLVNLIAESQHAAKYRKQISLDLLRTMPTNVHFDSRDADGIQKMQEVLQAFCAHNTAMGYCQGMNFIAGMCLLYLDKEETFWTLIAITERYFTPNYYDQNLIGAQADQEVLKELLKEKLPNLHQHLRNIDIEISTVTLNWFLAVFFDSVPMETLLRIWDCFLLEGPKVLFRFALAILKIHERALLEKEDTISIMKHLKLCARLTFDVDGLMKVAFEELKPLWRRRDIASRRNVYLKTLQEQVRRRDEERRAMIEREEMFRDFEFSSCGSLQNVEVVECAAVYQPGKMWLCYGEQNAGKICKINCDNCIMYDLDCEFDSRIMCIATLSEEVILVGTLSWNLYAFSTASKEQLWNCRLHDAILSLCCHQEDDHKNKVFAALADGTIAILEDMGFGQPKMDVFYIPIGHFPVTSLLIVDEQLWCACGNSICILNASTLDTIDAIAVSNNPFDHILCVSRGLHGVWIAVKGSSILELWDPKLLICRLIYDIVENRYHTSRKFSEDDEMTNYNQSRVTALLPHGDEIWVGTGRGDLIIYELTERKVVPPISPVSKTTDSTSSVKQLQQSSDGQTDSTKRCSGINMTTTSQCEPSKCETTDNVDGCRADREEAAARHCPRITIQSQSDEAARSLSRDSVSDTACDDNVVPCREAENNKPRSHSVGSDDVFYDSRHSTNGHVSPVPHADGDSASTENGEKTPTNCWQSPAHDGAFDHSTIEHCAIINHPTHQYSDAEKLSNGSVAADTEYDASCSNEETINSCEQVTVQIDDRNGETKCNSVSGVHSSPSNDVLTVSPAAAFDSSRSLSPISEGGESHSGTDNTLITNDAITNDVITNDVCGTPTHDVKRALLDVELHSPQWSSLEDVSSTSTVSQREEESHSDSKCTRPPVLSPIRGSNTSKQYSFVSLSVDNPYTVQLMLQAKMKISDKSVKCLIPTRSYAEEDVVVSCAGLYSDEEPVLRWRHAPNEKLWTNEPILEICHRTNRPKRPSYSWCSPSKSDTSIKLK